MTDMVGIEHEGELEQTLEAVQFSCQDKRVWIPRSQLHLWDEFYLVIPKWLADDRGLEPDWDL